MASERATIPLGDLSENYGSKRISVKELDCRPGPYPYYEASGIVDHVDSHIFEDDNKPILKATTTNSGR